MVNLMLFLNVKFSCFEYGNFFDLAEINGHRTGIRARKQLTAPHKYLSRTAVSVLHSRVVHKSSLSTYIGDTIGCCPREMPSLTAPPSYNALSYTPINRFRSSP